MHWDTARHLGSYRSVRLHPLFLRVILGQFGYVLGKIKFILSQYLGCKQECKQEHQILGCRWYTGRLHVFLPGYRPGELSTRLPHFEDIWSQPHCECNPNLTFSNSPSSGVWGTKRTLELSDMGRLLLLVSFKQTTTRWLWDWTMWCVVSLSLMSHP